MNTDREKPVNTRVNQMGYGPTVSDMRMSRLSHPRGTLLAMILLAAVFLLFGMFAAAAVEPGYVPPPSTVDGAASLIGDWVLAHASIANSFDGFITR
jgi:hypothetical protein